LTSSGDILVDPRKVETTAAPPLAPHPAQALRLRHFSASASVDAHCHVLPGLDDGPTTLDDALALCEALVADGITHAIATPHQLGRYDGRNSPEQVRAAAVQLRIALAEHQIPLSIEVGADVRIDERMVPMLRTNQILAIGAAGKFLLLELPHDVYVDPRRVIADLHKQGVCAIITHPERHEFLQQHPSLLLPWLEQGAVVQLTAGSIVGDFGAKAQETSWLMLQRGWASLVATDAHDTVRRPPRMTAAADAISKRFSHAVARRLCVENPHRVLRGDPLMSFAARSGAVAAQQQGGLRPRRVAGRSA
jgi:protein-tyrosine phosphatase